MSQNPGQHSVRRIVLPSGRTIEVVRFQEQEATRRRSLHVCPHCESHLVQPVAWSEAAEDRWELTLECPNCWWAASGTYDREQVDELEDHLDLGLAEMLEDLARLAQANMTEQLERFVAALHADHVLPEDF